MNSELLAQARHAQERLIDAERDVAVARADFYRAVRRLHLHGSSLREVAADLGLSHQRVHQIVEEAGGSRRWVRIGDGRGRARVRDQLPCCTFCGKPQNKVRQLIAGPGVYICGGCVTLARHVITDHVTVTTEIGPVRVVPDQQPRAPCNFCGKQRSQVAGQAGLLLPASDPGQLRDPSQPSEHAIICDQCLDLCEEIVDEAGTD
jgi:bacterioferritin-associated ferredoxin